MPDPVLFHNARIHTLDPVCPRADWMVAIGDRIQRVGQGPLPADVVQRVDLGGHVMLPGFIDAHIHFFQTGIDMMFTSLVGCTTVADVAARIRAHNGGTRTWVLAHSYEEDALTDITELTCAALDEVESERPVWLNRIDYHSSVVNSAALRRLGIPPGTKGLMLGPDGKPDGRLRAEAYLLAKEQVARMYPLDVKNRAIKAAGNTCAEHGITAVHALEGGRVFGNQGVNTLLKREHLMPVDITLFLQEMNVHFTQRFGFEHLGGCILIDGSIGSYTAALHEPYDGRKERGMLYQRTREFTAFVEEAHVAGVQLAFHAIGPRAIDMVIDAYERALRKFPRHDHRHRIEHFELATDEQMKRCLDLGIVISAQPAFELFWGGPEGMYASRLGERWRNTNRVRSMLDLGLTVGGGSDSNVTPAQPLLGVHAAVNHPNDEQRISVEQALRMMTLDAAYAGFNEKRQGSLSLGKDADFVLLDRDPFEVAPQELRRLQVRGTYRRGRPTYGGGANGGGTNGGGANGASGEDGDEDEDQTASA